MPPKYSIMAPLGTPEERRLKKQQKQKELENQLEMQWAARRRFHGSSMADRKAEAQAKGKKASAQP